MSAEPSEAAVDRRKFMVGAAVATVALSPLSGIMKTSPRSSNTCG